jgi:hypothetical protein
MSSLQNRKPLCIGKKPQYYKTLYNQNHSEFCRRFIDTVLIHHFDLILNKSVENNIGSDGINYKIRDTDAFLWMIRDLLDNFMSYTSVKDVVFNKDVTIAIDKMFVEIKLEYNFIQLLFTNAAKNEKQ